jgi:cystathionine gamma-synthase
MAYVKGLYSKQLDWAAKYGLKESQIRISVGLESSESLLEAFEIAMRAADETKGGAGGAIQFQGG